MLFLEGKQTKKTLAQKLVPNHLLAPMVDLPEDIITEILSRLPVTSLLRFRSVSNSWKSLIDSHDFTTFRLNKFHKLNSNPNLVFSFRSELYAVDLPTLDIVDLNQPLKSCENSVHLYKKNIDLLGSCNGLLCITNSVNDIAIWNPSLRKHWILPSLTSSRSSHIEGVGFGFGFGFDPLTGDYKLVTIYDYIYNALEESNVSLFSCITNSWKTLPNAPNPFSRIETVGVFVDHALHWAVCNGYDKHIGAKLIVAFDLRFEVFNEVPLPELDEGFEIQVSHLGGCLSMAVNYVVWDVNYKNVSQNTGIDIWVMKQYGYKDSWFKLFTLVESLELRSLEFVNPYSSEGITVLFEEVDVYTLFWCNFCWLIC